jgi:hypothetical protein
LIIVSDNSEGKHNLIGKKLYKLKLKFFGKLFVFFTILGCGIREILVANAATESGKEKLATILKKRIVKSDYT